MTLKDIEYFVVMAREKSISRAAEQLFVAQPALSQCLQKLEKEMNVRLFVRSSRGVQLTSEGECFLAFAENVLREKRDLGKRVQDVENAENGSVTVGFTGTQASYVLPYILPAFQEKHPGVTITLVEATSDEIEEKLLRREVDVGILHLPVLHSELDYFEISRDDMVIIPRSNSGYQPYVYHKAGEERPYLDMEFLREEPLILTPPHQRSRMVCDQLLANAGIVPHVKQTSRNLSTLDALAQVDYATTIMPQKQVSPQLRRRGVFRIDESVAVTYSFVAATLRGAYLPIPAQKLCQEFRRRQYTF